MAADDATPKRLIAMPDLPTVASAVPGYRAVSFTAMYVPAKTPVAAIRQLNAYTVHFLNSNYAKAKLYSAGSEAVGSTPEEFTRTLRAEIATSLAIVVGAMCIAIGLIVSAAIHG